MNEPTLPNETLRQQLSAFVDGELPGAEAELLVRRLARDADLKQAMSRYLLVGEALRLPSSVGPSRNFSARIAAVIERDDAQPAAQTGAVSHAKAKRRIAQWLAPLAGMAVAAGVAAVVVFGLSNPAQAPTNVADAEISEPAPPAAQRSEESESYVVPAMANTVAAPIAAARLTNYVVAHSEYSSPLVRRNMLTGLLAGDDAENVATEDQAPKSPAP